MSFRDNLQYLRATRNMTQEQLAMLLGVSRQSVTKWEAEKSYPEMDKLLKICQLFDCSLDDLVQGDIPARAAEMTQESPSAMPQFPAGPPTDVCGYDEHQRKIAWQVPTGVAFCIAGFGLCALLGGIEPFISSDSIVPAVALFASIVVGLMFLIPAGMEHSAFVRAHPFVEDFYTPEEKQCARAQFTYGLIGGIACILLGMFTPALFEGIVGAEASGAVFLFVIAIGVWLIIHFGMMLGRTNIPEYNKSALEDIEVEDITSAQIDNERREALLAQKRSRDKIGAVCGAIMIGATLVGLAVLFVGQNPLFWLAWPAGGLLCGLVSILMEAFGHNNS